MTPNDLPRITRHPHPNIALDAASVEAVARRVAELIRTERGSHVTRGLVDAATLAVELGVERSWVYAHRDELGAVQLGGGSRPRLRFDVEAARNVLARLHIKGPHAPKPPTPASSSIRPRRRRMGDSPPLLPIKGTARPIDADREHL